MTVADTAGQDEYSALREQYMKTGQGFVLVYSITSPTSFDAASKLREQILKIKGIQDIPIILVGNKIDLEDERAVTTEEGKELAQNFNCAFLEASAKTNTNVEQLFRDLVKLIIKWKQSNPSKDKGSKGGKKKCSIL